MQKVKIYAWVIYRILVFYAKRHIYIATALLSVTAGSLFEFATTGKPFCLALPFVTALIIYVPRHIYFKLDEFASPGIQGRHLRERQKAKEELNKYIEESIAKDFGR